MKPSTSHERNQEVGVTLLGIGLLCLLVDAVRFMNVGKEPTSNIPLVISLLLIGAGITWLLW